MKYDNIMIDKLDTFYAIDVDLSLRDLSQGFLMAKGN
jgi:hypothetical protein